MKKGLALFLLLALLILIVIFSPTLAEYLSGHMLSCPSQTLFGATCPGCGFQRALIVLMQGDLLLSLRIWPALIPVMIMLGYLILHLVFNFKKGPWVLLILFIFNTGITIINYIIKFF